MAKIDESIDKIYFKKKCKNNAAAFPVGMCVIKKADLYTHLVKIISDFVVMLLQHVTPNTLSQCVFQFYKYEGSFLSPFKSQEHKSKIVMNVFSICLL